MEAGMLCTIDGEIFHMFAANTWIGDSSASFHISNNDTSLFNATKIHELVQVRLGTMHAAKKGKLYVSVHQINGAKQMHTLWP